MFHTKMTSCSSYKTSSVVIKLFLPEIRNSHQQTFSNSFSFSFFSPNNFALVYLEPVPYEGTNIYQHLNLLCINLHLIYQVHILFIYILFTYILLSTYYFSDILFLTIYISKSEVYSMLVSRRISFSFLISSLFSRVIKIPQLIITDMRM